MKDLITAQNSKNYWTDAAPLLSASKEHNRKRLH
jgi:hypothetical protein